MSLTLVIDNTAKMRADIKKCRTLLQAVASHAPTPPLLSERTLKNWVKQKEARSRIHISDAAKFQNINPMSTELLADILADFDKRNDHNPTKLNPDER